MAQRRLFEAEVEMDRKSWERRNSDMAQHETNRQHESQHMEQTYGLAKLNRKTEEYSENEQ